MPKLKVVPGKRMLRWLKLQGFTVLHQKGSHLRLTKGSLKTTIPLHNCDLPRGTIRKILNDTKISQEKYQSEI